MTMQPIAMSLDMINRHYSEPNRNRYESLYYWEELYTLIKAAGFVAIEIPYEPVWQFGGRSGVPMNNYCVNTKYGELAKYRAYLQQQGIEQVTAVTFEANLFVRNDQLGFYFGASEHFASQAIEFAAGLGARTLVISPSAYKGRLLHYHPQLDQNLAEFRAKTAETLASLADKCQQQGVTLAVRPEYWGVIPPQEVAEFIQAASPHLRLALNTAQLHIAGIDVADFINQYHQLIGYVQLADSNLNDADAFKFSANPAFPANGATQVFRDVGQGSVPFAAIFQALQQHDYQGAMCICNHQTRDPMRALLRSRHFINPLTNAAQG